MAHLYRINATEEGLKPLIVTFTLKDVGVTLAFELSVGVDQPTPGERVLFVLDELPSHCSIYVEVSEDAPLSIRFRAARDNAFAGTGFSYLDEDENETTSEWSGWFRHEGEAVELEWWVFWIEDNNSEAGE